MNQLVDYTYMYRYSHMALMTFIASFMLQYHVSCTPGTGSGVGTFILNLLEDEYPDVYRFVTAVYPSLDDDVITSPYNSVLAMRQLTDHADCVLPIENQVTERHPP